MAYFLKLFLFLLFVFSLSPSKAGVSEDIKLLNIINYESSEKALELIKKLESNWDSFENDGQKARFYIGKAFYHVLKAENQKVKTILNKLLKLESITHTNKINAYKLLSQAEMELGEYSSAFNNLHLGFELIPLVDDHKLKYSFLHGAVNVFQRIKAYEEALIYAKQAEQIAIDNSFEADQCFSKAQILEISLLLESKLDYPKLFKEASSICQPFKINLLEANILKNKGLYYLNNKEFKLSEEAYEKALTLSIENGYKPEVLQMKYGLARVSLYENDYITAKSLIRYILKETETAKLSLNRKNALYTLAEVYKREGNYLSGFETLVKANAINAKIQSDLSSRNLAYQQVKYAQLDQEAQIKILDQNNKVLKLESEVELQSKRNFQLLSVLVLLLLSATILWLWRLKNQKEKYRKLSQFDDLTGIYNRRYALKLAELAYSNNLSQAKKNNFSVIVFDLDYFKAFNDQHGHAFGDWVLKEVARVISNETRKDDIFGRLGGEEFVLILPRSSIEDAQALAQRCAKALQLIESLDEKIEFNVTASFGVVNKHNNQSLETLFIQADDAMYKAKKMGRNRIHSSNN